MLKLKRVVYECPKCERWYPIESLGTVIAGPLCWVCKVPTKRLVLTQLEWKFEEPKRKKSTGGGDIVKQRKNRFACRGQPAV